MTTLLGIIGSPRKNGNTHVLVDTILSGAAGAGAETESVFLGDLTIRQCNGCHACWHGAECPKKDDMNGLYPKIAQADVLVFGTPVYWYGPTALMKAFIDRFVYFNCEQNRPGIRGKSAVIAVPFEEDNPDTAAGLIAFFERCFGYLEVKKAGQIIVPSVTRLGEVKNLSHVLDNAAELGKTLAQH